MNSIYNLHLFIAESLNCKIYYGKSGFRKTFAKIINTSQQT